MISFREIIGGALTRFVPGAVLGQAAMIAFLLIGEPPLVLGDLGILAAFTGLMATGYAAILSAARRRLRSDANVTGRRAFITGVAAGAFHFGFAALVGTLTVNDGLLLGVAAGAGAATLMFFPWIRLGRAAPDDAELPLAIPDDPALPASDDLDWIQSSRTSEADHVRRRPSP